MSSDGFEQGAARTHGARWTSPIALVFLACGPDALPVLDPGTLPAPIAEFAHSQGIDTLRGYTEILHQPGDDVTFFRLRWGNQTECQECAFAEGTGILREGRTGWMSILVTDFLAPTPARFFDFLASDLPLFDPNLPSTLRGVDHLAYLDFRQLVTCDTDAPEPILRVIAESVAGDGWRGLGLALLEHTTVLHSEPILEVLADLQGLQYAEVRGRALMALGYLRAGVAPPMWAGDRVCSLYSGDL